MMEATRANERDPGILFFGAVAAGVGHELRNVFSILGQVGGLLRDHLSVMKPGTPMPAELLGSIQERLGRLNARGIVIVDALGRLAHSTDAARSSFDLSECADLAATLLRDRANRRRVPIRLHLLDTPLPVEGDMFALLFLIYRCLLAALDRAEENVDEVLLETHQDATDSVLTVSIPRITDAILTEGLGAEIVDVVRSWPARLEPQSDERRGSSIVLRIPCEERRL